MLSAVTLLGVLLLGGEAVRFDEHLHPQFTERQVAASNTCVREGLAKWAATGEGKAILARLGGEETAITIIEDDLEEGPGRAPQPAMATMLAATDRKKVKHYELILNPALAKEYGRVPSIALGEPATPADVMAAAWAAEMLHVEFYARGIPLPHHDRPEFQERWQRVAEQLGFPLMQHATERR